MGKLRILTVVAFVVAAAFIYFLVTSPAFRAYTSNSIMHANTTVSLSQSVQLFDRAKNMTEGQFVNWSLNKSNNNTIISGIKSNSSDTGNFIKNIESLWGTINAVKNYTGAAANGGSIISNAINGSSSNTTPN